MQPKGATPSIASGHREGSGYLFWTGTYSVARRLLAAISSIVNLTLQKPTLSFRQNFCTAGQGFCTNGLHLLLPGNVNCDHRYRAVSCQLWQGPAYTIYRILSSTTPVHRSVSRECGKSRHASRRRIQAGQKENNAKNN